MSVESQVMQNMFYLESWHMKEMSNHTVRGRKKKLRGNHIIIGLGQRIIEWEKKNCSVKKWSDKLLPTCVINFLRERISLVSQVILHPSIASEATENVISGNILTRS